MNQDDIHKLAREIEDLKDLSGLYGPGFADLSDEQVRNHIEKHRALAEEAMEAVEAGAAELKLRQLKSILR